MRCPRCNCEFNMGNICPICGAQIVIMSTMPQQKKKTSPVVALVVCFIVFIFAFGVGNDMYTGITGEEIPKTSSTASTKKYITMKKFEKIEIGMTYDEVVDIVGYDGNLTSETSSDGYEIKIYGWYGKNGVSNAVVSFENGKVTSKAQLGLE